MTDPAILVIVSPKYGEFRVLIDAEDWDRVSAHNWSVSKKKNRIYFYARINGKLVSLHRFITNAAPGTDVDHIHHVYTDLRKSQLSVGTRKVNSENQRKTRGSSRFKGVEWYKRDSKWRAQIMNNKKRIHIGYFPPTSEGEREAGCAYNKAALKLFTRPLLNDIPGCMGMSL